MIVTLDAKNARLGKIASQAAAALIGKSLTSFKKNQKETILVQITNASKLSLSDRKRAQKEYASYSGYPGGLRYIPIKTVIKNKGYSEVLHTAILGMLPKNKLRAKLIKNLTISE